MQSILQQSRLTFGILTAAATVLGMTIPAAAAASGDINRDGTVSKADVQQLQKWLLTSSGSLPDWSAGDMNQDGILDARDLTLLKRQVPEKEDEPQYIHLKGSSISCSRTCLFFEFWMNVMGKGLGKTSTVLSSGLTCSFWLISS